MKLNQFVDKQHVSKKETLLCFYVPHFLVLNKKTNAWRKANIKITFIDSCID